MFPSQEVTLTTNITSTGGKTLNFDFEVGDFVIKNGIVETLEGLEGLKVWIKKVLKTKKSKFKIYNTTDSTKYGVSLLEIVTSGHPMDYIKSQLTQEITNTLLTNSDITLVSNFLFTRNSKRALTVSFTVTSIYGTTESEVKI